MGMKYGGPRKNHQENPDFHHPMPKKNPQNTVAVTSYNQQQRTVASYEAKAFRNEGVRCKNRYIHFLHFEKTRHFYFLPN